MSGNQPFTYTPGSSTLTYKRDVSAKSEAFAPAPPVHGTLTGGLLVPGGGEIQITGHTVSGIFNKAITSILLLEQDGPIYKYEILVVGNIPLGGSGPAMNFAFTDESGDTYHLAIWSPVPENHYVAFNSGQPNINKIAW